MGSHFTCLRPFTVMFRFDVVVVSFVVFLYAFFGAIFVIFFDDLFLLLLSDFRQIGMTGRSTFLCCLRLGKKLPDSPDVDDDAMGIGLVLLAWLAQ